MDAGNQTHPLSLKVMRISRPSLSSAWEPFFSNSPSFSAHSTASALSLQGSNPLLGHPKTLRDLSHAGHLLTLPSSFGAIQLGETFSSYLSVNNESNTNVSGVSLKIEMQTATNKITLAEYGGQHLHLVPTDTLEAIVSHEIKELSQHVLACTVSYKNPQVPHHADDADDPSLQTFRKFYKFMVTNPLSVKTKVHTPKSPTAHLSKSERDKIFLEVHIQNLTQDPLWFERIDLEPLGGWTVEDGNTVKGQSVFSGTIAMMQPQDMRQYIYILRPTPERIPVFPVEPAPGTIIPLGRLNISWRSSFGEPGRLLTSVLSRRIPLVQPSAPPSSTQQAPASAIPPYLQRGSISSPSRPRSPSLRANTPPPATSAKRGPFPPTARPQSPATGSSTSFVNLNDTAAPTAATADNRPDLEVDLTVRKAPSGNVGVEQIFDIDFSLAVSAIVPREAVALSGDNKRGKKTRRTIRLAVQHTIYPHSDSLSISKARETRQSQSISSPGFSTPSSLAGSPQVVTKEDFNSEGLTEKLLAASVQRQLGDMRIADDGEGKVVNDGRSALLKLPSPYTVSEQRKERDRELFDGRVKFLGSSILYLPPIRLYDSSRDEAAISSEAESPAVYDAAQQQRSLANASRKVSSLDFSLTYVPAKRGLAQVGGVRVLLIDDHVEEVEDGENEVGNDDKGYSGDNYGNLSRTLTLYGRDKEARILREWSIVAEVCVH